MLPTVEMFNEYMANGGLIAMVLIAIAISELALVFLVFLNLAQIPTTARTKPILREMHSELKQLNRLIEKAIAEEEETHEPRLASTHPAVVPGPGHHLHERKPR